MAFHFQKPVGFSFKPGQFVELTLLHSSETDHEGNRREFSIASAPHEENIMIVTRSRASAMKRTLTTMPLGTEVLLDGPYGDFVLRRNATRPAVFLTGGIGITPFRSMVVSAAHEKLSHKIFLFCANRRPEDAPFLEELRALESENPNYRFIPTMTRLGDVDDAWQGERGHITKEMLLRHVPPYLEVRRGEPDINGPLYSVAGPQRMVAAMRAMLNAAGVDDDDIRTEEFSGYQ